MLLLWSLSHHFTTCLVIVRSPVEIVQDYMEMVRACADKDRDEILARSTKLGFLTGAPPAVLWHCTVCEMRTAGAL